MIYIIANRIAFWNLVKITRLRDNYNCGILYYITLPSFLNLAIIASIVIIWISILTYFAHCDNFISTSFIAIVSWCRSTIFAIPAPDYWAICTSWIRTRVAILIILSKAITPNSCTIRVLASICFIWVQKCLTSKSSLNLALSRTSIETAWC